MTGFIQRAGREAIDAALSIAREIPRSEVYTPNGVAPQFRGTELERFPNKHTRDFSLIEITPTRDTGVFNGESLLQHPLIDPHMRIMSGRENAYLLIGAPDKIKALLSQAQQKQLPFSG